MSKNVLIIEDDITNITLIKRILTKKGISVESASDAISAWEKIHDNHYDLFIIDLNLPFGANGFEFLSPSLHRRIQNHPCCCNHGLHKHLWQRRMSEQRV
ncbi:MAG: response regulator [Candidatus Kapaibacteriota bacterium]